LPHTSKKYRKQENPKSNNTLTYIIVGVIIAIVAAGGGYYAYASLRATSSSLMNTTTNVTSHCSTSSTIECAEIGTTYGTIYVELFNSSAPKTVANFVYFAESGFYDNLVWHRIVKGFVIQTGDPDSRNGANRSSWGQGGDASRTVPLEIASSLQNNYGYLGIARSSDPNSGSSQFYINMANNTSLNGNYTVFGKVLDGMNVAIQIENVPVDSNDAPLNPVYMTGVTIADSF